MGKMIDLKDLLKHEVLDLYSAEEQIIAAMPAMIEKAGDSRLKKSLQEHLKVTEKQKTRLDKIKKLLSEGRSEESNGNGQGFFSSLFGGASGGSQKCKGMEGLISEGEKMMGEDMTPEVLDAAIIASAQKIEHYEICGYGTARAYARQLNLGEVAELLEETLDEEYEADDRLTDLAIGSVNEEAEQAQETGDGARTPRSVNRSKASGGRNMPSKNAAAKGGRKSGLAKKSPGKRSASATKSKSRSGSTKSSKSKSTGRQSGSTRGR
ncbi:MAG: YciE/YciF ferroxidase family protein [Flavitalea sp.]